ncbi:caspase-1 [Scaptodrosophila lebanonensis]|uniref:Caspase-1 n=1 Tax=Drosophila lebanonensis TaxID=7225 RepID=A0A6J2THE3_DROLE|nr:caspase-1 [Scaptodrosophila lebanonensis]
MVLFGKKKEKDSSSDRNNMSLVPQDPRTRVNTTSAATETTHTTVQNSTIINKNNNTATYLSQRQTVTHTRQERVMQIDTRRTPTQAELIEMFGKINTNNGNKMPPGTSRTTTVTTTRGRPSTLNSLAPSSITSFRHSSKGIASSPHSPCSANYDFRIPSSLFADKQSNSTLVKVIESSVEEKSGSRVTQQVERIRLQSRQVPKSTWPPTNPTSTGAPRAKTTTGGTSSTTESYISPYNGKLRSIGYSPSTITSNRPQTQGPSSNSSTGAIPKHSTVLDAKGISNPKPVPTLVKMTPPTSKSKLKPALVYIFNHEKFDTKKNEDRKGTNVDMEALRSAFEKFNCKVEEIKNATVQTVHSTAQKLEVYDFRSRSALVIVILSHGTRHGIIAAKNGDYSIDDSILFPILRNQTLKDKPKMFFIQACKGDMEQAGFHTDAARPHGSPNEILKCYSTFEGYVSYRTDEGSPFIQTFCDTLKKLGASIDITAIMDQVRILVKAYTKDSQIPSVTSTLTQKYVFGHY